MNEFVFTVSEFFPYISSAS